MTSKLAGVFALQRRSRHATFVWRLWACGIVFFAGQAALGEFVAPVLALAGLLIAWSGLHRHASKYESSFRGSRRVALRVLGFASGLLVVCSFALFGVQTLNAAWNPGGERLPAVVLSAFLVGVWMAWTIVRNSWQVGFIAIGASLTILAGLGGFWVGPAAPPAVAARLAGPWLTTTARLWIALFAAAAAEGLARRRLPKLVTPNRLLNLVNTTAFVMLLAYMAHVEGNLQLVAGLLATAWTIRTIAGAPFPLLRDWQWFRRWRRRGWSGAAPSPTGLFMALAFVPSIGAAAQGNWTAWSILCGLALFASVLKIAADRQGRRSVPLARPAAKPPVSEVLPRPQEAAP
jgi:hypothetical protein